MPRDARKILTQTLGVRLGGGARRGGRTRQLTKGTEGLQQDIGSAFPIPLFAGRGGGVRDNTAGLSIMLECAKIPSLKNNERRVTECIGRYEAKFGGLFHQDRSQFQLLRKTLQVFVLCFYITCKLNIPLPPISCFYVIKSTDSTTKPLHSLLREAPLH